MLKLEQIFHVGCTHCSLSCKKKHCLTKVNCCIVIQPFHLVLSVSLIKIRLYLYYILLCSLYDSSELHKAQRIKNFIAFLFIYLCVLYLLLHLISLLEFKQNIIFTKIAIRGSFRHHFQIFLSGSVNDLNIFFAETVFPHHNFFCQIFFHCIWKFFLCQQLLVLAEEFAFSCSLTL